MLEYAPIVLGAIVGASIARCATARARIAAGIVLVVLAAAIATVVSGEYRESAMFAMLDLAEVTLGAATALALVTLVDRLQRTA